MERINKHNPFSNISPSFLAGVFLFLITFALFSPVINHDFINYDDQLYITENDMVIKGLTMEGLYWAFTNISAGFWFPLTWLSHMLDCQVFGLNPGGHHLTSLLLHCINSLILFYLFKRITGAFFPSLLVAIIFAVHPLHVEPVAWASSRKDLLSTFFWIITMWSYTYYARYGGFKRYLLVLLSFSMGLMSKPMLITLPFVLLLMDYWPFCRFDMAQSCMGENLHTDQTLPMKFHNKQRPLNNSFVCHSGPDLACPVSRIGVRDMLDTGESRKYQKTMDSGFRRNNKIGYFIRFYKRLTPRSKLIAEKIPLLIISLISISITYLAEKDYGAVISLESLPLPSRLADALISYAGYIYKSILPIGLSVHYPPYYSLPFWKIIASFFLLLIISFISIKFHRKHPYIIVGWLWFLGTLVPVIGFIQIGSQSMADRYMYVPLIGFSIMFAWVLYNLSGKLLVKKIFPIFICIITVPLIILTHIQLGYWQNGVKLFGHAVELNKNNLLAQNNLGYALAIAGREREAIEHYYPALGMKLIEHEVHFNLGKAFQTLDQYDKAIFHYKAALTIDPDYLKASLNLGSVYYCLDRYDEAIYYYLNVLRINPNHAGAHNNLGVVKAQQNRIEEAVYHFNEAIKIDPDNEMAMKNFRRLEK